MPKKPFDPTPHICKNCRSATSQTINDMCPICYLYFTEHKKHRPKYKKEEINNNLEYLSFVAADVRRMKKEFKGDNELIRLTESVAFAMMQLEKALAERKRDK